MLETGDSPGVEGMPEGVPVLEWKVDAIALVIGNAGPMTPGTHHTHGRPAAGWLTRQLRRRVTDGP